MSERDYKREYQLFHSKKEQKIRRAQRNAARRALITDGRVRKGDGQDVHHKDNNTANNSKGNLAVLSKSKNRSIK